MDLVGQIVGGEHGKILVRQKSGEEIELGELLVVDGGGSKTLLQAFNLTYGSQIDESALELVSGLQLEGMSSEEFAEKELRNYVLASVKSVAFVKDGKVYSPKKLPPFFSSLRRVEAQDLSFLEKPGSPLFVGNIRSGSRVVEKPVYLNGSEVLPHHVLIAASTGKGKSNLLKVMLWHLLGEDYCGVLVLDPHNEYFAALKHHERATERLAAYSTNPKPGQASLKINYHDVKPWHFNGVFEFSQPQFEAMYVYYKLYKENWLKQLQASNVEEKLHNINPGTISVLQRRFGLVLDEGVFAENGGEATVKEIVSSLRSSKKVVIDTSSLSSETELLVGSVLANAIFSSQRREQGIPVSIAVEEAPRVLKESAASSVFSSIAREGRKFGVGLIAVTQMASMIPSDVLANLSTKIILGNEMAAERQALVSSSAQDLTEDYKTIGALDKGEAIVTSVFTRLALPIQIPEFKSVERKEQKKFV